MAFLGLLLKRTNSQLGNDTMHSEFREEYFKHKQIRKFHRGSSEIALEITYIFDLFYCEKA